MGSKFSTSRMKKELAAQTMTTVTTSGDISAGGFSLYDVGTLAATGTSVSSSAQIVNHVTMVTEANSARGVQLPTAVTNGEFYVVGNILSNQILKLYPSTGSQFNGFPANQAINITGSAAALCFYASSSAANAWIVVTQGT